MCGGGKSTYKKQSEKIVPYSFKENGSDCDINVFVLFSDSNQRCVDNMKERLKNKKIIITKGLAETEKSYDEKVDVINYYDYVVVIISKTFLEDLDLLDVLVTNYEIEGKNRKILPIIIWKDLYKPEVKAEVLENFKKRIDAYRTNHFDDDFSGNVAEELKKMQQILNMLKYFIKFATERDRKTNLQAYEKLLKYIRYDRGEDVADKEEFVTNKKVVVHQTINVTKGGQVNLADGNSTINATTNKNE